MGGAAAAWHFGLVPPGVRACAHLVCHHELPKAKEPLLGAHPAFLQWEASRTVLCVCV